MRSALDPEREEASPGFFAAFPPSSPSLPERAAAADRSPTSASAPPTETVGELLAQASAQAPGIAAGFEDLVDSLRANAATSTSRATCSASLGDEAAFALEPAPGGGGPTAVGVLPYLQFVADGVDEDDGAQGARRAPGAARRGGRPGQRAAGAGLRPGGDRGRRDQQPARLADGRAHLRGLRRAGRDRHRPGRASPSSTSGDGGLDERDALRAGHRGLPGRGLAARLLRPRRPGRDRRAGRARRGPGLRDVRGRFPPPRRPRARGQHRRRRPGDRPAAAGRRSQAARSRRRCPRW